MSKQSLRDFAWAHSGACAVRSISHRGFSAIAPENTLVAYRLSRAAGYEYVETDVSFTKDNVAVLLHDNTVDRTSNGTGNLEDLTFDEVRALDFGSWKSPEYAGEQIPAFEEFVSLCRDVGLHPYIELKFDREYSQEQLQQLAATVRRYGMADAVTWISFDADYLARIAAMEPRAQLGHLAVHVTPEVIEQAKKLRDLTGDCRVLACAHKPIDVQLCIDAGLALDVWTVDDPEHVLSLDPYVTGVISNALMAERVICEAAMGACP